MRAPTLRHYLLAIASALSLGSALAQQPVSFAGLDADADGKLSRAEFGRLRVVEMPELFADLDEDRDHHVSLAEWTAGSPDRTGIPRGSRPPVGAAPPKYPSFVPHGRNAPRFVREKADKDVPRHPPLTGHGGVPGRNRSVPPRLPAPPPRMPPGGMPPPY